MKNRLSTAIISSLSAVSPAQQFTNQALPFGGVLALRQTELDDPLLAVMPPPEGDQRRADSCGRRCIGRTRRRRASV
jgi:hypothetical protein